MAIQSEFFDKLNSYLKSEKEHRTHLSIGSRARRQSVWSLLACCLHRSATNTYEGSVKNLLQCIRAQRWTWPGACEQLHQTSYLKTVVALERWQKQVPCFEDFFKQNLAYYLLQNGKTMIIGTFFIPNRDFLQLYRKFAFLCAGLIFFWLIEVLNRTIQAIQMTSDSQ